MSGTGTGTGTGPGPGRGRGGDGPGPGTGPHRSGTDRVRTGEGGASAASRAVDRDPPAHLLRYAQRRIVHTEPREWPVRNMQMRGMWRREIVGKVCVCVECRDVRNGGLRRRLRTGRRGEEVRRCEGRRRSLVTLKLTPGGDRHGG